MARPRKKRVKSLHDDNYGRLVELLVERRVSAGLNQQVVADRMGWNQSVVAKIETRQRRMDVIEFLYLAEAIDFDALKFIQELRRLMKASGDLS